MKHKLQILLAILVAINFQPQFLKACTGISFTAKDGSHVVAPSNGAVVTSTANT